MISSIPRAPEVKQFFYENAVIGETRRFRQLDRYEAHYACLQYAHQKNDWWGQPADMLETISPDVQLPMGFTQPAVALSVRARRPTVPFNLCKAIVDRFTGLLFSDTRKPDVTVEGDTDEQDLLQAAMEQMRFWAKMREARVMGGSNGSVLITVHLRSGRFVMEVHNPKHCQVLWKDKRMLAPLGVLKCYKHIVEEDIVDTKTGEVKGSQPVQYLYRRIITEEDDTVFKPLRMVAGTNLMTWEVESEAQHNLGFFPGVWIQNLPVLEQEDGDPDCAGAWQGFDTYDRILSQMNKAVLLNLDPTPVIKVDPKTVAALGGTVMKGSENALYVGESGSASYLEITGSGVDAGMKVCALIKQNILDVTRCVLVDPSTLSGAAQSAKAIEYIYAPMLEKADDLRAQYGDLGVVPLLVIIDKIARKLMGQRVQLPEGQVGVYKLNLPPRKGGKPHAVGKGGYIRIQWGPYFAPTESDKETSVRTITAAKTGLLLSQATATRQIAPLFNIRDPEAEIAAVAKEQEEQMSMMMGGPSGGDGGEMAAAAVPAAPKKPPGEAPGMPAGMGGKG